MTMGGASLVEINNRATESAEQDQTARICRLILPYTLSNIIYGRARQVKSQLLRETSPSSMAAFLFKYNT